MRLTRRHLLAASAASAAVLAARAALAAPATAIGALGRDASQYGVRPGSPDDQTRNLQRAIDDCARAQVPLALPPGVYRTSPLTVSANTHITGVRGASRLVLLGNGPSLLSGAGANNAALSDLTLDGGGLRLPERRGLAHLVASNDVRITGCEVVGCNGNAIILETSSGEISGNTLRDVAATAIASLDARGLLVARNTVLGAAVNGIEILRSAIGDDGTMVIDNRIEGVRAGPGGSGQYGNAINAYRAANVIVRGNRIRDCDFSAVRGNSSSNIQIVGNSVSNVREVALYSEFAFEGAVIASNTVDGAAIGVSVANFSSGGRLATVQGNIIRNLFPKRPAGTDPNDGAGIGIYVEADTAVTGNVIENAPSFGIVAGYGRHLRDVTITGNIVRNASAGIGVSVVGGAGTALVSGNLIAGATQGAIVGLDHARIVIDDLSKVPTNRPITVSGNLVR